MVEQEGGNHEAGSPMNWVQFKYQPQHINSLCDLGKTVPELRGKAPSKGVRETESRP